MINRLWLPIVLGILLMSNIMYNQKWRLTQLPKVIGSSPYQRFNHRPALETWDGKHSYN